MPHGIEQIIRNQIVTTKLRRFSINGKESRIFYRKIDLYWLQGTHLSSRFCLSHIITGLDWSKRTKSIYTFFRIRIVVYL